MEVVCECQSAPDTLPQTFATPAADTSDTWLSHASARRRAGQGRHERSCRCEAAAGEHLLEPYALHFVWPLHLPLHLCEGGRQTPPFTPSVLSVHHQPHPPHLPQERTGANDYDDQSSVDIKAVPILHSNQAGFRGLSCCPALAGGGNAKWRSTTSRRVRTRKSRSVSRSRTVHRR